MKLEARVESLYVGRNKDLEKLPQLSLKVGLSGIANDKHGGFTKGADLRNTEYVRGTQMRNDRQWTACSTEELAMISKILGVPRIDPAWIGANMALTDIPNLSELPKGSKLIFPQDAVLVVEGATLPCTQPGEVIAAKYPDLGLRANLFPKAALGLRGLVGVIERPGIIKVGDAVTVQVYQPKTYSFPS